MKMKIFPFEIHNLDQLTSCSGPSKFQKCYSAKVNMGRVRKINYEKSIGFLCVIGRHVKVQSIFSSTIQGQTLCFLNHPPFYIFKKIICVLQNFKEPILVKFWFFLIRNWGLNLVSII
jgi:hypothetical protein